MTVAKSRLCALSKCLPGQPALRLQLQFKHVTSRWRSSNENVLVLPNGHVDIRVKKHVRFRNMDLILVCILNIIGRLFLICSAPFSYVNDNDLQMAPAAGWMNSWG